MIRSYTRNSLTSSRSVALRRLAKPLLQKIWKKCYRETVKRHRPKRKSKTVCRVRFGSGPIANKITLRTKLTSRGAELSLWRVRWQARSTTQRAESHPPASLSVRTVRSTWVRVANSANHRCLNLLRASINRRFRSAIPHCKNQIQDPK